MSFEYNFKNKEASFSSPITRAVSGGTHITFEIILKKDAKYVALRRPKAIPGHEIPINAKNHPNGLLYFCHNLIRYGEATDDCINRIVKDQAGVGVKTYKIIDIESEVQEKDNQWAFMPLVIAELDDLPKVSNLVTEIVIFDESNIPNDFGWWSQDELSEFLSSIK